MPRYRRYAACSKDHRVEASFDWDLEGPEGPEEYSTPCPVPGCEGRVTVKLPIGAHPNSVEVTPAR